MQPSIVIIPEDPCLEQAQVAKKKVPKEIRSQVFAEIATEQAAKMTKEQKVARAKKAAEGRWGRKRGKPKP
jgi:hypothetical protein